MEKDILTTSKGDLVIGFLGHGSLMMTFSGKTLHIDPVSAEADYTSLPKADLIVITHDHDDHFDPKAVGAIRTAATKMVGNADVARKLPGVIRMQNGDVQDVDGVAIEAVPAYNIVHLFAPGRPFHPKGVGNGYVLTLGDRRVYIAGDTENTPEMKALKNIDIAFLPMNLPYTMTPEMVADAARAISPKILYPYHYGETDTARLITLLSDHKNIEVRIRSMK